MTPNWNDASKFNFAQINHNCSQRARNRHSCRTLMEKRKQVFCLILKLFFYISTCHQWRLWGKKKKKLKQHHLRHLIATKSQDQQNSMYIYLYIYVYTKTGGIFFQVVWVLVSRIKHLINFTNVWHPDCHLLSKAFKDNPFAVCSCHHCLLFFLFTEGQTFICIQLLDLKKLCLMSLFHWLQPNILFHSVYMSSSFCDMLGWNLQNTLSKSW